VQWGSIHAHAQQEQDDEKFFHTLPEISYTGEQALLTAASRPDESAQMHVQAQTIQSDGSINHVSGSTQHYHAGLVDAR